MKAIARIFALVLIIVVAWLAASREKTPTAIAPIQDQNTVTTTASPTATVTPEIPVMDDGWQRYDNATFAFSIRYPALYTVNEEHVYSALGPGSEIKGIAFMVPSSISTGTNLSADSYLSVERQALNDTECRPRAFLGQSVNERTESINGRNFTLADSSGAGAGNRYDETVAVTSVGTNCYGLRLFIHSTVIENYEPGTVREYDRQSLLDDYSKFRASFVTGA